MNEQKDKEIKECLAELSVIVDSYNPTTEYSSAIVGGAIIAICLIVIISIGLLWGLILLLVGGVPIIYKLSDSKCSPSDQQLAERACALMSSCVDRYKYPERDIYFLHYNHNGDNLALYNEFVSIFPQMDSKKLKKLASIKLRG